MKRKTLMEELAYTWCRLNDPESWFNKAWNKDEIKGAMKVLSIFVDKKTRLDAWENYIK